MPARSHVAQGKRVTKSTFTANGIRDDGDSEQSDEDAGHDRSWAQSFYQNAEFSDSNSSLASDASEESEDSQDKSRTSSFATRESEEDGSERFIHDTAAILVQRMQESRHSDDMQSELMGLRFSGGADGAQVSKAVASALTKYIHNQVARGAQPSETTTDALTRYRELIRRPNATLSMEEQIVFLLEAQSDLSKRPEGSKIIPWFFRELYNLDIFEEEGIFFTWYSDERSAEKGLESTKDAAKPFIDWLREDEEESSGEEDDDNEE